MGIIVPTDELIFFRGVGIPPTSDSMNSVGLSNAGTASLDGHWTSNRWGNICYFEAYPCDMKHVDHENCNVYRKLRIHQ